MTVQENKELIRRYVAEVYNAHDLNSLGRFIGDEMPDESVSHLQEFFTAFPDSHVTVEDLIAEGDKVVGFLLIEGTNAGPFAGRPPTGKKVQFRSYRVYRIAEGKIAESWAMQDRLALMEQLGLVQSAADEVNWAADRET